MAINSVAFASKFTGELDKFYIQQSKTGFLADNVMRAKFVGAKTVLLPSLEMTGLVDYDRDKGFTTGALTVTRESYTLQQDRSKSFMLDREDEDETGIANLAGTIMKDFVKYHVVPETDAYVISKLAAISKKAGNNAFTYTADSPYKLILDMEEAAFNSSGDEELVAFVSPDVMTALKKDPLISRTIDVGSFKQGGVDFKVNRIDNVSLIPVSAKRMKSAYTFISAEPGTDSGDSSKCGFAPTADAKDIKVLMLPKNAAALVRKSEKMRTFTPDQNQTADAYKFDYRLYYDLIVPKSKQNTIFAATEADASTASTTPTTPTGTTGSND